MAFRAPNRRRIYLMRHGSVTYFDATGRPHFPETVPLNEDGRAQADAAGSLFAAQGVTFDRVLTSGLPRTVETATRVLARMGVNHSIVIDPELREIEGGKLASIPPAELVHSFTAVFSGVVAPDVRFLGGESVGELFARVLPRLAALRSDRDWSTLLLVLHGGVNRALLSYLLTGEAQLIGGLHQEAGCINAIDIGDDAHDVVVRYTGLSPAAWLQPNDRATTMEHLLLDYQHFARTRHV
jgi:broad specificity phosphatase PhoE